MKHTRDDVAVAVERLAAQERVAAQVLERILADAKLDVCGRADFLVLNRCLRAELAASGSASTDREGKHTNIAALERLLLAAEHAG